MSKSLPWPFSVVGLEPYPIRQALPLTCAPVCTSSLRRVGAIGQSLLKALWPRLATGTERHIQDWQPRYATAGQPCCRLPIGCQSSRLATVDPLVYAPYWQPALCVPVAGQPIAGCQSLKIGLPMGCQSFVYAPLSFDYAQLLSPLDTDSRSAVHKIQLPPGSHRSRPSLVPLGVSTPSAPWFCSSTILNASRR